MIEIFEGKTIEEAKQAAISAFGVEESKITFEVIEDVKKGLFGKIKSEAKVKAEYNPSKVDSAISYLKNILKNMQVECEITLEESEDCTVIDIKGDDVGAIIGKRGETLDALQYIVSMIINKGEKEYHRIVIDSNGYREKRKKTLQELADKISKSVMKNGFSSALEPMNPYERRIIHSTVSEIEGVYSRSVGEEPYRKVIIYPVNKKTPERRGGGNSSNRGGRDNGSRDRKKKSFDGPRSLDLKTSFEKDYKKPIPDENIGNGLYGKIEI